MEKPGKRLRLEQVFQGMISLDVCENLDGNIRYVLGRWTVWIKITQQFPNQRQDTKDRVDCVLE